MTHSVNTIEDYDRRGGAYASVRVADEAIRAAINRELRGARYILNVGAGTGSYEPSDRYVIAVEPSATMRRQRGPHLPPALNGVADALPFDNGSFDAALAILTIHHWPDLEAGLREVRRVTKGPVVVMSFDPTAPTEFWMTHYVPEMAPVELARYPCMERIQNGLGGPCRIQPRPVRLNCTDRFQVALYGRPEEFLREEVRRSQSAWSFLPEGVEDRFVKRLAQDLSSGAWDDRYGHLRIQPEIVCQLRLIISEGPPDQLRRTPDAQGTAAGSSD